MKIKQLTKWCMESTWTTIAIMFGIMTLLYIVTGVAAVTLNEGGMSINGGDATTMITMFILGLIMFALPLRLACTNGMSRKAVFISIVIWTVLMSALATVGNLLLSLAVTLMPGSNSFSALSMLNADYIAQLSPAASWLIITVWTFFGILCATAIGLFIGGAYYRLGKVGKVLWAAGLPVFLCVAFPLLINIAGERFMSKFLDAVAGFFQFLASAPLAVVLLLLVVTLVFFGFNWLLMRRAPITPAAT